MARAPHTPVCQHVCNLEQHGPQDHLASRSFPFLIQAPSLCPASGGTLTSLLTLMTRWHASSQVSTTSAAVLGLLPFPAHFNQLPGSAFVSHGEALPDWTPSCSEGGSRLVLFLPSCSFTEHLHSQVPSRPSCCRGKVSPLNGIQKGDSCSDTLRKSMRLPQSTEGVTPVISFELDLPWEQALQSRA